jgi:hypothetical protein
MRLEPHLGLALSPPFLSRLADIGAIAFAGQKRFFKAIAVANEPAREGGGIHFRTASCGEFARQFRHRDVVLLPNTQKLAMRIELRAPASAKRLGREAAAQAIGRHQIDDQGWRDPEMSRRGPPRMTGFDMPDNAFTKILGIGLRHRKSPPIGSQSQFPPNRYPPRFKLTVRRSRAVRAIDELWKAIGQICDLFQPEECKNYFNAAGYGFN